MNLAWQVRVVLMSNLISRQLITPHAEFVYEHVFDELYKPILDRLGRGYCWHDFAIVVRRSVVAFAYQFENADPLSVHRDTLTKAGYLLRAEKLNAREICLSCLIYIPISRLIYGYYICDRYIKRYCSGNGILARYLFYNAINNKPFRSKPFIASVYILRLSGSVAKIFIIAQFFYSLYLKFR